MIPGSQQVNRTRVTIYDGGGIPTGITVIIPNNFKRSPRFTTIL